MHENWNSFMEKINKWHNFVEKKNIAREERNKPKIKIMAFHPQGFFMGLVTDDSEAVLGSFPWVPTFSDDEHEEMQLPNQEVAESRPYCLVFLLPSIANIFSLSLCFFSLAS